MKASAAKTDETVTDGHPVIGHPRADGDVKAREKSEMLRLRGIQRTNRCNYGSRGTDGYDDPSSSRPFVLLRPPVRGKPTRTVFEQPAGRNFSLAYRDYLARSVRVRDAAGRQRSNSKNKVITHDEPRDEAVIVGLRYSRRSYPGRINDRRGR